MKRDIMQLLRVVGDLQRFENAQEDASLLRDDGELSEEELDFVAAARHQDLWGPEKKD